MRSERVSSHELSFTQLVGRVACRHDVWSRFRWADCFVDSETTRKRIDLQNLHERFGEVMEQIESVAKATYESTFPNTKWEDSAKKMRDTMLEQAQSMLQPVQPSALTDDAHNTLEAVSRYCSPEQINQITAYVLSRRSSAPPASPAVVTQHEGSPGVWQSPSVVVNASPASEPRKTLAEWWPEIEKAMMDVYPSNSMCDPVHARLLALDKTPEECAVVEPTVEEFTPESVMAEAVNCARRNANAQEAMLKSMLDDRREFRETIKPITLRNQFAMYALSGIAGAAYRRDALETPEELSLHVDLAFAYADAALKQEGAK
jgi:hypothetical protein